MMLLLLQIQQALPRQHSHTLGWSPAVSRRPAAAHPVRGDPGSPLTCSEDRQATGLRLGTNRGCEVRPGGVLLTITNITNAMPDWQRMRSNIASLLNKLDAVPDIALLSATVGPPLPGKCSQPAPSPVEPSAMLNMGPPLSATRHRRPRTAPPSMWSDECVDCKDSMGKCFFCSHISLLEAESATPSTSSAFVVTASALSTMPPKSLGAAEGADMLPQIKRAKLS